MALLTQKAILNTFEEMLREMPFDKITVSALVKRCEVSHNTFYYHYQNIDELLDVWLTKCLLKIREEAEDKNDWKTEIKLILLTCQNNAKLIDHIVSSISREQFERYVFNNAEDAFVEFVRAKTEGRNLREEQIADIAEFCRYSFVGMFLKANWEHFKIDVDAEVEKMWTLFDAFVDSAADSMTK